MVGVVTSVTVRFEMTLETESQFPDTIVGTQLEQVARLMKVKETVGKNRDIFYVNRGGWDHHSELLPSLKTNIDEVDEALGVFKKEMISQGLWNNITIVTASEFGRTLTSNGIGTDHAWAGNHAVMGGSVKGGRILGSFIDDYTDKGPQSVGRGRLIPTSPWEAIWAPLCKWFGVSEEGDLSEILPNLENFNDATGLLGDSLLEE